MNIRTCYGCPLRHVDGKRCEILESHIAPLRGIGCKLSSISFRCDTRKALFSPGECVSFMGANGGDGSDPEYGDFMGWVMGWSGGKVRIACEETNSPVVKIQPDRLRKIPDENRRVCLKCGKPEGVSIQIKEKSGELRPWFCDDVWDDELYDRRPLPCVYAESQP